MSVIKNVYWSLCKVVRFYWKLNFLDRFSKNIKYHLSLKSIQWVLSCYMRTDGRTDSRTKGKRDMTKLIVAFRNFANALNTVYGTGRFITVLAAASTFCFSQLLWTQAMPSRYVPLRFFLFLSQHLWLHHRCSQTSKCIYKHFDFVILCIWQWRRLLDVGGVSCSKTINITTRNVIYTIVANILIENIIVSKFWTQVC
jgi:hypothetical protein